MLSWEFNVIGASAFVGWRRIPWWMFIVGLCDFRAGINPTFPYTAQWVTKLSARSEVQKESTPEIWPPLQDFLTYSQCSFLVHGITLKSFGLNWSTFVVHYDATLD